MTARWSGVEPRMERWQHLSSPRIGLEAKCSGLAHRGWQAVSRGGVDIECS
jgi:hypothetical protein